MQIRNYVPYFHCKNPVDAQTCVKSCTKHLACSKEYLVNHLALQSISVALIRSDVMLESRCMTLSDGKSYRNYPYCCWKQVEINTIASGFGWLSLASLDLHRYSKCRAKNLSSWGVRGLGILKTSFFIDQQGLDAMSLVCGHWFDFTFYFSLFKHGIPRVMALFTIICSFLYSVSFRDNHFFLLSKKLYPFCQSTP